MNLPELRSHKTVQAAKIQQIVHQVDGTTAVYVHGFPDPIWVNKQWMDRCKAAELDDPGYFVLYQDGYSSWSPSKAFEEGYTRIEEGQGAKEEKPSAQMPSIGRVVHYHGPGHAPNGEAPSSLNVPPMTYPADVVIVHEDGTCTLWVKTHIGFMILQKVPFSEEPREKHWTWPPRV